MMSLVLEGRLRTLSVAAAPQSLSLRRALQGQERQADLDRLPPEEVPDGRGAAAGAAETRPQTDVQNSGSKGGDRAWSR